MPELLIAGDTCRAAFSCLQQLATGAEAFPLPGHALVRSEALNDIVSFFAFPCALLSVFHCFSVFSSLFYVFFCGYRPQVCGLIACYVLAPSDSGCNGQVILAKAELNSVAAARQINHTAPDSQKERERDSERDRESVCQKERNIINK